MEKGVPVDIHAAFEQLTFLPTRTPESHGSEPETFAGRLSDYREGGVFVAHWAGLGEWERHLVGDEIVMILEGSATVYLVQDGRETSMPLSKGQLVVVPQNTWHRLSSDDVKILTVTPRPTEHQVEFPGDPID